MSDELKWWEIERAVWERGPGEKAQRAVLAQLAKHADAQGITFVGQPKIAERSGFAAITVKRAIAALELGGWLRVEERAAVVETRRGFEKKGNRYHLNLVRLGLVLPPRAQGNRTTADEGVGPGRPRRDEGVRPATQASGEGFGPAGASAREGRVGWSGGVLKTSSAKSHGERGEVSTEARRGINGGAPVNNNSEAERQTERLPIRSPHRGATAEKERGESPEQQRQAETSQRLACQYGGSRAAAVYPNRLRAPREPRDFHAHRASLDGEDAALWDEVSAVLRACGVSPESSGRKQRRAISEALKLYTQEVRPGASIADAGALARQRWAEQASLAEYLLKPSGVTQFFGAGEWLHPQLWRFTLQGEKDLRRRADAGVGMYR